MKTVNLLIEVLGTYCNDWPLLRVGGNNDIYFDDRIENKEIIEFEMLLQENNVLVLEHHGKYFGENGRWDTVSENDVIIQDRAIRPLRIEIDGVDICKYQFENWPLLTQHGEVFTNYFGFNGTCRIEFTAPVYDWIITKLVHRPNHQYKALDLIIETSHSDLFDYENDLRELEEIDQLIKENAHLFDKPTKI
jgi:hypothetical protein